MAAVAQDCSSSAMSLRGSDTATRPWATRARPRFSMQHAFGVSQGAHFLRQFLYLGLNEDEQERQVFDGIVPVIGSARHGEFNIRFGQPGKTLGRYIGALFPFSDATQSDPVTGTTDGLLARLDSRGRVPKIVVLDSSAEYWSRQASLIHTDVAGNSDVEPPGSTRIDLMAGTQHGGGGGGLPLRDKWLGQFPVRYAENSVDYRPLVRAALVNLDRWVSAGQDPPPSRYPGSTMRRPSRPPGLWPSSGRFRVCRSPPTFPH